MSEELITRLLGHEGFETKPYQDHLGFWTFGHGLTFITEEESKHIVEGRLVGIISRLTDEHKWLLTRPQVITEVLVEMVYQLGWTGCHNFKNMWAALLAEDYATAKAEGLDSKWHSQTPGRAEELMDLIGGEA